MPAIQSLTSQFPSLDIDTICAGIAVQRPYFAFENLYRSDSETIVGSFRPEQPLHGERGPVTAAEIGRHLAILGACAASAAAEESRSTKRIYYLAQEAHYLHDPDSDTPGPSGAENLLLGSARILSLNKRELRIQAEASTTDHERLATLEIRYQVLSENLFRRLFHSLRRLSLTTGSESPYKVSLPLCYDLRDGSSLTAHSDAIPSSSCAGHFQGYPAWPVALIMHCLGRVAGRLLQDTSGQTLTYTVLSADLTAGELVPSDQALSFSAAITMEPNALNEVSFHCRAFHQKSVVAQLTTTFRICEEQTS